MRPTVNKNFSKFALMQKKKNLPPCYRVYGNLDALVELRTVPLEKVNCSFCIKCHEFDEFVLCAKGMIKRTPVQTTIVLRNKAKTGFVSHRLIHIVLDNTEVKHVTPRVSYLLIFKT